MIQAFCLNDGNVVAVGGFFENDFENDSSDYFGTVKVFVYCEKASQWVQLGSDIVGTQAYDYFGRSVDLSADGLTIAVGAFSDTDQGGILSGRASVYRFVEQNVATADWEMVGGFIDGEAEYDYFGKSVSLSADGSKLAVGAYKNNGADTTKRDVGNVRVFAIDQS